MEKQGLLRQRNGKWYYPPSIAYPAQSINIRSTSGRNYAIVNTADDSLLETIESAMAFYQVHPGAIYLHQGDTYLVTKLDLESRTAYVEPAEVNYYTRTTELSDLRIIKEHQRQTCGPVTVSVGEVEVNSSVIGYRKKAQLTEEIIGEEPLDLPPQIFNTVSLWFDLPPDGHLPNCQSRTGFRRRHSCRRTCRHLHSAPIRPVRPQRYRRRFDALPSGYRQSPDIYL